MPAALLRAVTGKGCREPTVTLHCLALDAGVILADEIGLGSHSALVEQGDHVAGKHAAI